jgi:hypothetical protein
MQNTLDAFIGQRVKYSAKWLKSMGIHSGDMCFCEGTITGMKKYGSSGFTIATIDWKNPEIPEKVNIKNLTIKGKIEVID